VRKDPLEYCPLLAFWASVQHSIEEGMTSFQGSLLSHHLFDHLLRCMEMLYGTIIVFTDLDAVATDIELPGWGR
jgi:hypothetical protein